MFRAQRPRIGKPLSLAVLAAAPGLLAQTPAPATGAEPPKPTIRVGTNLVLEDVTVTDAQGNPVHNLPQSTFTLLEDGKPQNILHFEEHATLASAQTSALPPMPKLPPGVFTNYTPVPEEGPVNVILLDSLNTPLESQAYVHAQLREFARSLKPGTRVALFALGHELHLLQGFTSNPETLQTALTAHKGMRASTVLNDSVSGDTGPDSTMSSAISSLDDGNDPSLTETVAQVQQFEAETAAFETQMRAQLTLDALNQLARYLSGLPGRKNLIWFSGSFPIDILPDGDLPDPFAVMGDNEDEFRETVTLLARSHVAVFPVDARGLMGNANLSAANSGAKYVMDASQFRKDNTALFDQRAGEHGTMIDMADRTGGHAYINTNGLKEAVDQAITLGQNYYTLSYRPASHGWDGNFHNISIKLPDKKLKLTYRNGYYADDPEGPPNKAAKPIFGAVFATAVKDSGDSARTRAMRAAMQFGAPQPTEIVMKLKVTRMSDKPEDTLADGVLAQPKVKGPYLRYSVDYAADARHVQWTPEPDGSLRATCEFAVLVYDDQGGLQTSLSRTAVADIPKDKIAGVIKNGMHMHQEISVPAKGHYWLRAGIHDRVGDHMGAVELPLEKVPAANAAQ